MNKTSILAAAALLLLAAVPASGYHIVGNPDLANPGLTSGDWFLSSSPIIVCESDGPADPRNNNPDANAGQGGLCSTGRNAVTGVAGPAAMPAVGAITRLDVCSATTTARTTTCASGGGSTGQHGYTAEVGAFVCFVPTDNDASATGVANDFALYYEELYAWWTWEWFDPATGGTGIYTNGHVAVFPDATVSKPGASVSGSVETSATAASTTLTDFSSGVGTPANPVDLSNNCGSSPACPPGVDPCTTQYGPVIRAPNTDNTPAPPPVPSPLGGCSYMGPVNGPEPYVVGATAVVKEAVTGLDALIDAGAVVMLRNVPLVSPLNIGGFCWYANTPLVVTDLSPTPVNTVTNPVAFQVCLDLNNDGFCLDSGSGGCQDVIRYSHQDGGAFVGTMAMPPTVPGCPGTGNPPVVFICQGVHVDTLPHVHPSVLGEGTMGATAGVQGYDSSNDPLTGNGFCAPLVAIGKPYITI